MNKEKKNFKESLIAIFMIGLMIFVIIAIIGSAIFATQDFADNEQNSNYQSQHNFDLDLDQLPITI